MRLLRWLLVPASFLYAFGWQVYLIAYRLGLKKAKEPHSPVFCVGNLQAGGSGKSPTVLAIARHLKAKGYPVVVSCSGYGSPRSEDATFAPPGELSAAEWGDEAAMFRWLEPELELVVGRNRVTAAGLIHEHRPEAIMLMDDGFQHLPLRKHLTLVLDPLNPDNRFCLPAGPYREPRFNRRRADLLAPGDLGIRYGATKLLTPQGESVLPKSYSVLCAIGNPDRFLNDLENHCLPVDGFATVRFLEDHDPLTEGTLMASFPQEVPVVITAKDWVKLRERPDCKNFTFLVAVQELQLEPIEILERRLKTSTRS